MTNGISNAWDVLLLFLIPIGGGIPAGVLLARVRGIGWPIMMVLYLISDIILACIFEPLMLAIMRTGKRSKFFTRFSEAYKKSVNTTLLKYGANPGPLSLILVAFAMDPMTGRTAAYAAGHRFVSGWTLAIIGDMFFFTLLMVSTLWLNKVLGDGTWAVIIVTVAMIVVPFLFRRLRALKRR